MKSLKLRSPAKLNLFLKVHAKRPDGFHNITTLFERISLHDDIHLQTTTTGLIRVYCQNPDVPTGPKNLCFKMAALLKKDFQIAQGVNISIKKRIPVAAGLGGGSSNAATVLLGLNKLWKLNLTKNQMVAYAQKIGSDVAFFLYQCSWALGTQRGDKIEIIKLPTKLWHVLVCPRIKIYSAEIYQSLKKAGGKKRQLPKNLLTKKDDDVNILLSKLRNNNIIKACCFLKNDLEDAIMKKAPQLLGLKERLKAFNPQGVMTSGSGPTVFCITQDLVQARKTKAALDKRFSQVWVVRTF